MDIPHHKLTLPILFLAAFAAPAHADLLLPGDALNYDVIYTGTGGHNLQITNVTVNGNIGVGGTGVVQDSGPSTINGSVDFSAANTGQFHNTNGSNVISGGEIYNDASITSDLTSLSLLSATYGLEPGTHVAINGNTTIHASSGVLDAHGNRVFDITSYSSGNGKTLTIDGDGHDVVLNFLYNSNVNLGGDVNLVDLTPDQVLFNFDTFGKNISLNNNASSYPFPLSFKGIILAPEDAISLTNAALQGRVYGGGSSDMQIVSGTTIHEPVGVPEPAPVLPFAGLLTLGAVLLRKRIRGTN